MAIGTHLPPTSFSPDDMPISDKAMHAIAYCGLAVFAATAWRLTFGWFHRPAGLALLVALSAFGAFDELTQPYFHRNCDIRDWAADIVGVAIGLVLFRITLAIVEARRGARVAAADAAVQ